MRWLQVRTGNPGRLPRLWLTLLAISLALAELAGRASVVFNDTFEPDGPTPATRNDDGGAGFGLDIQWRPRISGQIGAYSVTNDPVFGNALRFSYNATYLWIIGQFDNDASDGVTLGSTSIPASMPNVGDGLTFSTRIRTATTLDNSSALFYCGLTYVPGGPRANDPASGESNAWTDPCTGYFLAMSNGTAGPVMTGKQLGSTSVTPYGGAAATNLSPGITGANAGMGLDTLGHTIVMQFTRVSEAAVQIDSFWDGLLISTATDTNSPYTQFNSLMMLYGPVADYILDDVKLVSTSTNTTDQPPSAVDDAYSRVSNVAVGGGGYVIGMVIHPADPNLMYLRTDVGGAYRWNAAAGAWAPLLDWVSVGNVNLYGVESLAIDPSNTNIVYLACGKNLGSSPRGIYKSTDRGASWSGLYLTNVRMSANDGISGGRASPFVRNAGERLMVDPNNGSILYFGSRSDGLWKSVNAAVTWSKVTIPNQGADGYGITFVAFDPKSGSAGTGCSNLYIGVFGTSAGGTDGGVYQSSNAGSTWTALTSPASGNVNQPRRGQCSAADGTLWVTHENGVAKAARTATALTDVTPSQSTGVCYNGLALDPVNPSKAVVIRGEVTSSAPMYRTTSGGASWSTISAGTHTSSVPWWTSGMWAAWVSACAINPSQPNQLWYSDWYGVWKTDDYTAGSPTWHNYEQGHEELVVFTLSCPPTPSSELLSGSADVEGMRHTNLNTFPPFSFGNAPGNGSGCDFQASFGLDYCESDPAFVVRASGSESGGKMGICKSGNNGASWTLCPGWSSSDEPRRVAVSASNTNVFLAILSGGKPLVTSNGGTSFTTCAGISENGPSGPWETAQPLAADRVDGTKFYYYIKGKLYRSTDSGQNFTAVNTSLADNTPNLKAMPAVNGCLVLSLMVSGLWLSSNSGSTFTEIKSPLNARINARAMGLGRPATGSNAWIYVYGTVDSAEGCHVSQDLGATWTRIDTGSILMGCGANIVEGSRQVLGRVFIGTSGRGIFQLDGLALPRLSIAPVPGGVNAGWPASAAFDLYSTETLQAPMWVRVPGSPVLSNGCWNLTVPATGASRFYRLGGP